jgi:hypothetical protein
MKEFDIKTIIQVIIMLGAVILLFIEHGFIGFIVLAGLIWMLQDEYNETICLKNKLKEYQDQYGDL